MTTRGVDHKASLTRHPRNATGDLMSKLLKLKKWLTLPDAAAQLSSILNEPVSEADLLQLSLDDQLQLSVFFPNLITARKALLIERLTTNLLKALATAGIYSIQNYNTSYLQSESFKSEFGQSNNSKTLREMLINLYSDYPDIAQELIDSPDWIPNEDPQIIQISGVYDLVMVGGDRFDVMLRYQELTNGEHPDIPLNIMGIYVDSESGDRYQLLSKFSDAGLPNKIWYIDDKESEFYPSFELPDGYMFVVRPSALTELEAKILNDTDKDKLINSEEEIKKKAVSQPDQHRTHGDSLLISLGIMAKIISESAPKFKHGKKPNAKQIADEVENKAMALLGKNADDLQISNLRKDIGHGIDLLESLCSK